MRKVLYLGLLLSVLTCSCKESAPLYKDASATVEKRVRDLLSRMTLEEKCCQMQNRFLDFDSNLDESLKGMSWGTMFSLNSDVEQFRDLTARVQRYMRDSTRLGIPIIPTAEGIQGLLINGSTIFPHALAQGSCFDPELVGKIAEACAREAAYTGVRQVLSPVLEIARDPRWGRVEETYGEDPFLIAENAIAFVKAYQDGGVACTAKHFVAHGSPTGGLNCASVSGGERELRSLYLYPFARVIAEASPFCIMSCYSSYDGVPVTGSHYYLTELLRDEIGFGGYVYADWGAVERLENFHHCVSDNTEAAHRAVLAGVDLNVMGAYGSLKKQVEEGKLDISVIDLAVSRILRVKFELGLFDKEPSDIRPSARSKRHMDLAKEVADESAILLENNGILPLDTRKYRKIALLGPNSRQTVFGDYSWADAFTPEGVNLLQGLKDRLPQNCIVRQADGCDWWSRDDSGIAEAARIASESDIAIVAVGSRSTFLARKSLCNTAGEGNDLSSLELPGCQEKLLKAVKATGKPMVVVLVSGKPFAMPWVKDNADAFIVQWYAGERQGESLADILLGNVNPSGRLNISFPRSTGNLPCYYNYLPGDREYYGGHGGSPEKPGERYVYEKPYALWSFGSGLSYSEFRYVSCTLDRHDYSASGEVIGVEVALENTSGREGKEVVQLYVHDKVSSVAVPVQQLKAFRKVSVPAHGKATVRLEVPVEELALVDESMKRRVEPGEFEIRIGSSSENIHFNETITIHE
ncbi:MAG: glycoside hydrolase family 3 C-terminal domain-containing protein [Bacteroidales bacterium]|nr:glycoside hydrolase family 3 C-terminal domain-containing protein [Bacteroidales bacterium]